MRQFHEPSLKLAELRLKKGLIGKRDFLAVMENCVKQMKVAFKCFEDFRNDEDDDE